MATSLLHDRQLNAASVATGNYLSPH